jgi:predicted GIY-YIG superfamily endonuclease
MTDYIYRHYDKDGNLLYVGISLSVISRIMQHKNGSHWFNNIANILIL